MLSYKNTGKLSENILDNPNFILWNTLIGEGSAEGPSTEALLTVELSGNVSSTDKLTVTTQAEGKPPVKTQFKNLVFSHEGTNVERIWLHDTACSVITISVQLNDDPSVKKSLNFECGE
jgi:hypothetical protein